MPTIVFKNGDVVHRAVIKMKIKSKKKAPVQRTMFMVDCPKIDVQSNDKLLTLLNELAVTKRNLAIIKKANNNFEEQLQYACEKFIQYRPGRHFYGRQLFVKIHHREKEIDQIENKVISELHKKVILAQDKCDQMALMGPKFRGFCERDLEYAEVELHKYVATVDVYKGTEAKRILEQFGRDTNKELEKLGEKVRVSESVVYEGLVDD